MCGKGCLYYYKMFSRANERRIKDTIDFVTFWIHSTFHEKYQPIENKLCHGPYNMDCVTLHIVPTYIHTNTYTMPRQTEMTTENLQGQ